MKGEQCLGCVVLFGAVAIVVLAIIGFIGLALWWERHCGRFARAIQRQRMRLSVWRDQLRARRKPRHKRDSEKDLLQIKGKGAA